MPRGKQKRRPSYLGGGLLPRPFNLMDSETGDLRAEEHDSQVAWIREDYRKTGRIQIDKDTNGDWL
ncbi:hypothetical protein KAR91_31820 [Candidatus Pacearchaeota archaeon]|nr:hypothetical protein [Candidatus Pacearchaeota archaeon]